MNETLKKLEILVDAVRVLKEIPAAKLQENQSLISELQQVISGDFARRLIGDIRQDYLNEKNAALNQKAPGKLHPESLEFLQTFGKFKTAAHDVLVNGIGDDRTKYTQPLRVSQATAAFNAKEDAEKVKEIKKLKEARQFAQAFNSVFSDHALQIGTANDPTRISSYIDYSPYIWNYQYYLSIPTLSQTVDRGIQIATREAPKIECNDEEMEEMLGKVLKRLRFVEKLRKLLLYSHLSPRGSLIVPIITEEDTVRFNVFNDTQFTYSTGYQYSRVDYKDDGADGVTQIFVLGNLLRNGVTAHFLCPGFEPIFAIGKNRLYQLKDAAEAVNIYLYTVKVLCIRAQIIVQKWSGEGQNDTLLQKMQNLTEHLDSKLSLSTSLRTPEGSDLSILNNNLSEGFAKVSPIIREYQGMISGIMSDYFYGSDTAYSANSFNIHATHQTIRADLQEGQIEPALRFVINQYLMHDKRFKKWADRVDDFDIVFPSLYEPTDAEKAEIEAKRIKNIIDMASYPELQQIFKDENLLGKDYTIPEVKPPTTEPPPIE